MKFKKLKPITLRAIFNALPNCKDSWPEFAKFCGQVDTETLDAEMSVSRLSRLLEFNSVWKDFALDQRFVEIESEITYSIGDRFKHSEDDTIFMLTSMGLPQAVDLVVIQSEDPARRGLRVNTNTINVKNIYKITSEEFEEITGLEHNRKIQRMSMWQGLSLTGK